MNAPPTPTTARRIFSRVTMVVASSILLAACARDVTAPAASTLLPTDPNKALVGAIDGAYTIMIDPSKDNTLQFGKSYVVIPAHSICDLETSRYGAGYWNSSCTPETSWVTITALVRDAKTDSPSIDFNPPMRFNPATNVNLYIYVSNAATLSNMTVMKYCSTSFLWSCVDESKTDASLGTTIDKSLGLVFRRIKHFSGYLIAE